MPAGSHNVRDDDDYLHSWEAFDRVFTPQPVPPGTLTLSQPPDAQSYSRGIQTRPMAPEPFSTPHHSHASTSTAGPSTPPDSDSLDRIWSEVRKNKERAMAVSPSKIKSLEVWSASDQSSPAIPSSPPADHRQHMKRRKS